MTQIFSYPNSKSTLLNPLVNQYRLELCRILLADGQSVINDGSGANREFRKPYVAQFKNDFAALTTVLIWADLPEEVLLRRLSQRDGAGLSTRWRDMHYDFRQNQFEPPETNEADVVLTYNQQNYEEIKRELERLLA